jgi:hypothetical protein
LPEGFVGLVRMIKYLKNVINEFPELIKGQAATPAHNKLFVIRNDKEARKLNEEQVLAFHHTVVQLLFMATRARQDIQMVMAFLTTRVKSSDDDNWGKLKRVLKYLNGTKYLKLRLTVDNLAVLKWYVDGSHNTLGLQRTQRSNVLVRTRSDFELLEKIKVEYEELDGDRAGDDGHAHARNVMVSALHTSTGIQRRMCGTISRNHQHSAAHKERQDVKWKED